MNNLNDAFQVMLGERWPSTKKGLVEHLRTAHELNDWAASGVTPWSGSTTLADARDEWLNATHEQLHDCGQDE